MEKAVDYADEILWAPRDYINEEPSHDRKDNIRDFAKGPTQIRVGATNYTAEVVVGTTKSGEMLLV